MCLSIHGDAKEKVWKDVPNWAPVSRKLGMVLFKMLITGNYSGITFTICCFVFVFVFFN